MKKSRIQETPNLSNNADSSTNILVSAGVKKGAGSITADITAIQDYIIIVCGDSPNMRHELNNYVWNDKKAGIAVDKDNHLCDPMRYAFNKLVRGKVVIV